VRFNIKPVVRAILSIGIVGTLCVLAIMQALGLAENADKAIGPLLALSGTALGFYFGDKLGEEKAVS